MTYREPAVIVPDAGTWALWGVDLEACGLRVAGSPTAASALVLPHELPRELEEAVRAAWSQMPPPRRLIELDGPALGGLPAQQVLTDVPPHARTDEEAGHSGASEGGDEGGDMMEIVGEPSRDGLVMESIAMEHGPLAPGLPGGLVIAVELDGDIVCSCEVRASLRFETHDPLAPVAWDAVGGRNEPNGLGRLVAIERERALSHLAWLSGFGVVLGWNQLADRAREISGALLGPKMGDLERLLSSARRLLGLLENNRRLGLRTRDRGVVPLTLAKARGLLGPNARASGLRTDVRERSQTYRELGFSIRTQHAGDAEARVLQRAGETVDSLGLIKSALSDGAPASSARAEAVVEGPRGPISRGDNSDPSADATAAARTTAGELARGLEWASALAVVASFDLSPWQASK